MKKKLIALIVVIALALGVVGIIKLKTPVQQPQQGNKTITIIIVNEEDNGAKLYDKQLKTDAETMFDLLKEHKDELKLDVTESSEYVTLNGLLGLVTEDWNTGPWWVYDSENSECAKELGYCPSVEKCFIKDGEIYIFTFTDFQ